MFFSFFFVFIAVFYRFSEKFLVSFNACRRQALLSIFFPSEAFASFAFYVVIFDRFWAHRFVVTHCRLPQMLQCLVVCSRTHWWLWRWQVRYVKSQWALSFSSQQKTSMFKGFKQNGLISLYVCFRSEKTQHLALLWQLDRIWIFASLTITFKWIFLLDLGIHFAIDLSHNFQEFRPKMGELTIITYKQDLAIHITR